MREQGWYVGPFEIQEARWFSDGTPTALVRDGTKGSYDPPPPCPVTRPLQLAPGVPPPNGDDLRRADDGGGPGIGTRRASRRWKRGLTIAEHRIEGR